MSEALEILEKYWKHSSFRSLQSEVIESVLAGKDTVALMPTGGGKSICFQVPALMQKGICIVISPLVALMKDQVKRLEAMGIKAVALTGGLKYDEVIDLLDNCEFGNYSFLYLSPERLQSDWVVERLKNLAVNLIAIDEAHCVSQWGHDFRPAYLKITKLRMHFTKVPFLALTASATHSVLNDLVIQLELKEPRIFQKSFDRKNLSYMVFEVEDKLYRLNQILLKNPQSSIIYVRNRKMCSETANQLQSMGFSATFYHGGMTYKEKEKNMALWINEGVQVIVATNAFGMGIDKANVKTVIHIHLPESIENYYQEAGRAGRNGEKAFAVILTSPADKIQAKNQFLNLLPDKKELLKVYVKLCNYFGIAYGEGLDAEFSLNLNQFCVKYDFGILKTLNAINFLDRQGILSLSQEFSEKISLRFIVESREVIRYISMNPNDEPIILALLRTSPGIYETYIAINLPFIAKKSNNAESLVLAVLEKLQHKEMIECMKKNADVSITFNEVREDERTINRISKYLDAQNQKKTTQFAAVLDYLDTKKCKSKLILTYFGETNTENCGICSYCISQKSIEKDHNGLAEQISKLLATQDLNSRELQKITNISERQLIFVLQELLDEDKIEVLSNNKYSSKTI